MHFFVAFFASGACGIPLYMTVCVFGTFGEIFGAVAVVLAVSVGFVSAGFVVAVSAGLLAAVVVVATTGGFGATVVVGFAVSCSPFSAASCSLPSPLCSSAFSRASACFSVVVAAVVVGATGSVGTVVV